MFSKILYIIFTISLSYCGFVAGADEQELVHQELVHQDEPTDEPTDTPDTSDTPSAIPVETTPEEETPVEQKTDKKEELAQMVSNGMNEFLNFNEEDLMKTIQEFYQKSIAKKHEEMLRKAPEALRNDILEAKKIFQEFVASFNLPDCLLVLCQDLRRDLDKIAQAQANLFSEEQQEKLQELLNDLEKLHFALVTGGFKTLIESLKPQSDSAWQMPFLSTFDLGSMMSNLQQSMKNRNGINEPYEEKDLIALHQTLSDNMSLVSGGQFGDQCKKIKPALQRMLNMITALKDKDARALVVYAMQCLDQNFATTHHALGEIIHRLDTSIAALANKPLEKETKKVLEHWRRDIAKYTRSLNVFASIKHHAGFRTPEGAYTFFKIITRAYQASHGLLELYQKDYRRDQRAMFISSAMDWAFTSSLSLWYFFAQQSDNLNDLVTDTVLGTKSIASLDEKQVLLYQGIAALQALPIAYNPGVWSKPSSKIMNIAGRISTAFVYHHLFHVKLFGNRSQGLWPNTDAHMKTALMHAFQEGKKYISSKIVNEVYWNTDSETLGNLEKWTLGIVKPEILGEAIDILFPFFFLQPNSYIQKIAKFDRKDLFKGHGIDYDALKKEFPVGGVEDQKAHEARIDREYIERNVLDYIMSSVGMYGGTYLATKYQKPIGGLMKKAAGGFGRVLVALDIFSKDSVNEWAYQWQDMQEEFEQILEFAKDLLKKVLEDGSPMRNKMIPLLQDRGLLRESDNTPVAINKRLIYIVLNQLAAHHLVRYSEAAAINRAFKKNPKSLDTTIDKVVDAIRNNLFGMAGGVVGSYGARCFGEWVYPWAKERLGSPVVTA